MTLSPTLSPPLGFPVGYAIADGLPQALWDFAGGINYGAPLLDLADANDVRTYNDAAGVLRTVASATELRDSHHEFDGVSWEPVGLLRENEGSSGLRNNTNQGAVVGTPGTLPDFWTRSSSSFDVDAFGVVNGVDSIDLKMDQVPSADKSVSFEATNFIPALIGQVWTETFCLSLVAGDLTNVSEIRLLIQERDAANGFVANHSGPDIKDELTANRQDFSFTATLTGAATAFVVPFFEFIRNGATPVNYTLRVGLPKIEPLAEATSLIKAFGTVVTRTKETITFPKAFNGYNPTKGRWVPNYRPQTDGMNAATFGYLLFGADAGATSWTIRMQEASIAIQPQLIVGNGAVAAIVSAGISQTPDVDNIAEFIFGPDSAQVILNGTAGAPSATGYVDGDNFTTFEIGKDVPHITIKSLAYFQ